MNIQPRITEYCPWCLRSIGNCPTWHEEAAVAKMGEKELAIRRWKEGNKICQSQDTLASTQMGR
jgi:hypothetical protein